MGGKKPSNRFIQDLLTVMEGLQRVGYVASKQVTSNKLVVSIF